MTDADPDNLLRYHRQMQFAPLGLAGQRRLRAGKALVVGVGGLGSWSAELLARAGVGMLRLVDPDRVEVENLHRQSLYDQPQAERRMHKVHAAAERLRQINPHVAIEPVVGRLDARNVAELADGVDVILDGTDNFPSRFVINDYAVRESVPWIFAGVVAAEGQVMAVVPGRTACLRCLFDTPPPRCADPTCRSVGVLGPAVAAVSAVAAQEALKLLAGQPDAVSGYLLKLDLWANTVQRVDAARAAQDNDCPCCKKRYFDFLEC